MTGKIGIFTKYVIIALSVFLPTVAGTASAKTFSFADETLNYVITYKWGLITKDTGDATLKLRNHGDRYDLEMHAKTRPWADGIFMVRDTLRSAITKKDLKAVKYTKISNEGDHHNRVEVGFSHYGTTVGGDMMKKSFTKDGVKTKTAKLTASGPTYDMLSVFYYLRTLDLPKLAANKDVVTKVTIFSGSRPETMTIRCVGVETITMPDKSKRRTYHVRFNFTSKGGKKSSEDMHAWLSVEAPHIPLHLSGTLPIGSMKVWLKSGG